MNQKQRVNTCHIFFHGVRDKYCKTNASRRAWYASVSSSLTILISYQQFHTFFGRGWSWTEETVIHGLGCLSTRRWSTRLRAPAYRFYNTIVTLCHPYRSQPHTHTLTPIFKHKHQCIKNIPGYPRSVQDSARRLLKRESVAGSDASAVHLQHATTRCVSFRLNTRLEKKRKRWTDDYGVGKF